MIVTNIYVASSLKGHLTVQPLSEERILTALRSLFVTSEGILLFSLLSPRTPARLVK